MVVVRCPKCGYIWNYKGKRKWATCPSCRATINIENNRLVNCSSNIKCFESERERKNAIKYIADALEKGLNGISHCITSIRDHFNDREILCILTYRLVITVTMLLVLCHYYDESIINKIMNGKEISFSKEVLEKTIVDLAKIYGNEVIYLWDIAHYLYEKGIHQGSLTLEEIQTRANIILNLITSKFLKDFKNKLKEYKSIISLS